MFVVLGFVAACSDAADEAAQFPTLPDQIDDGALPPDTAVPLDDTVVEDGGSDEVVSQEANIEAPRDLSFVATYSGYLDVAQAQVVSSAVDSAQAAVEELMEAEELAKARTERITKLTDMITSYVDAYTKALDESTGETHDKIAEMSGDVDAVKQRAGVALMFAVGYVSSGNGEKFEEVIADVVADVYNLNYYVVSAQKLLE